MCRGAGAALESLQNSATEILALISSHLKLANDRHSFSAKLEEFVFRVPEGRGYSKTGVFDTFAISSVRQPRYSGCIHGAVSTTMNVRATEDLVRISPEVSNGTFMNSRVAPRTVSCAGMTRYSPRGTCTFRCSEVAVC